MTSTYKSAEYIRSITGEDTILQDPRDQIAFVGRSNAGKSSVINCLAGRSNLAQSSSTPGKTRSIDFYLIDDSFYLVDLPGFGYTKTKARHAQKLREMIIWYLAGQPNRPQLVVHVIDAKAGITRKDEDMLDILAGEQYSVVVLANKIDKLNQSQASSALSQIEAQIQDRQRTKATIVPFSAQTGQGRGETLRIINEVISE